MHDNKLTTSGKSLTARLRTAALLLLPMALLLTPVEAPSAQAQRIQKKKPQYSWHKVTRDAGIEVHQKDHPDRDLPSFRGVGMVNSSIYRVLAVLEDTTRHTEWMERCVESRVIKQMQKDERIIYNRTGAMWPVADRDVVVQGRLDFDVARQVVMLHFKSLRKSSVPKVDGVVRMTNLSGHYRLVRKGPHKTHVTFEVDADPGGALPAFVVKWASRDIPIKTIKALREQSKDMGGRRGELVKDMETRHPFG